MTIYCICGAFDHCLLSSQKVAASLVEAERDLKLRLDQLQKRKIADCDDDRGGVDHNDVHVDCCIFIGLGRGGKFIADVNINDKTNMML